MGLAFACASLFLLGPSAPPVTSDGVLTVHGAHSGSTLRVGVRGSKLVVRGLMPRVRPSGCRYKKPRMKAICSLRGVGRLVIRMGPSGDLVRIKERLPVPLTIYLGGGKDKFIGNAERDTCYPGGARRNRCIGKGGRDICITGNRNSDCVGGGGNDYCQHGAGSDGCWGGPGRDVCRMGAGQDGCHGEGGNDRLYGGADPDRLYGQRGHDHCDGEEGWGKSQTCEAGPRR
jgi:hypothetical protein